MRVLIFRGLMIAALALAVSNGVAFAGPFQDASAAYSRGDYATALRIWRPFAQQGNNYAQYCLGLTYQMMSDYQEAIKWYRLAAEQGNADAQTKLGEAYAKGWGVQEDDIVSYMWLSVGDTYLANSILIPYVAGKMAPAQIALGQKMAKECKESNYRQCGELQGSQFGDSRISVPMRLESGIYVVPVLINNAIMLDFVVDSGAADVSIPADVVMTLMRTGTLHRTDFLGEKTYVLADGSKVPSQTFRIRSLKVGNKVLENVDGSAASVQGSLLLGQSFLSRFKSWSVDNTKHALLLSE
jgi:predicted aspartyl protease